MITEELITDNFNVISLNTDGCTILCENERLSDLRNKFNYFTEQYKYTFEETIYKKLVRTSINDYIAIKSDNKLKLKGDYEIEKELHKNPSNRIRAIALARYFIENIPIEETIYNPQDEYKIGSDIFKGYGVFDYLLYVKAKSNQYYNLIEPIENNFLLRTTMLPKNIRYYVSNNGGKMVKIYKEDNSEEDVNKGYRVSIANIVKSTDIKDYDINYKFYIDECNKLINNIKNYTIEQSKPKKLTKKEKAKYLQPTLF